jgi:phosphatidylglycerol:prolipoprotein diacylglycerol transferase
MLPIIFSLGPITIYSYGLLLFLGFLFGLFVIWKRSREESFEEEEVFDAVVISNLYAIVGARVIYILLNFQSFGPDVIAFFNLIGKPGFSLFGGLAGGILGLALQTNKRKWDFFEFSDIVSLGLTLTFVLGWLGSFLNGTSPGIETQSPLGLTFPGVYQKRHPVQLYFMILYLILFVYLWWAEGKYRTFEWYSQGKSGAKPGFLFFSFLLFSGLFGLILSPLIPAQFVVLGLSISTWLWIIIIIIGSLGIYLRSGRNLTRDIGNFKNISERNQNRRTRKRPRKSYKRLGTDVLD